jgi:ankyrin repeat protein
LKQAFAKQRRGDIETLESFKDEAIRDQLGIPTAVEVIAAIVRKDVTALEAYLARGFAVNDPLDAKQSTALHIAAARCQAEVIDLLLQKGADPKLTNSAKASALQMAEASCGLDSSSSQLLRAALP